MTPSPAYDGLRRTGNDTWRDKASGIKHDPNEYSEDPRYIIDLV